MGQQAKVHTDPGNVFAAALQESSLADCTWEQLEPIRLSVGGPLSSSGSVMDEWLGESFVCFSSPSRQQTHSLHVSMNILNMLNSQVSMANSSLARIKEVVFKF